MTGSAATMALPASAIEWQPSQEQVNELGPRGREWLGAWLAKFTFDHVEGLRVLEICRVVSAIERLEAEGRDSAAATQRRLCATLVNAMGLPREE